MPLDVARAQNNKQTKLLKWLVFGCLTEAVAGLGGGNCLVVLFNYITDPRLLSRCILGIITWCLIVMFLSGMMLMYTYEYGKKGVYINGWPTMAPMYSYLCIAIPGAYFDADIYGAYKYIYIHIYLDTYIHTYICKHIYIYIASAMTSRGAKKWTCDSTINMPTMQLV